MKSFLNTLKGKETEQELIVYKEKLLKNLLKMLEIRTFISKKEEIFLKTFEKGSS